METGTGRNEESWNEEDLDMAEQLTPEHFRPHLDKLFRV